MIWLPFSGLRNIYIQYVYSHTHANIHIHIHVHVHIHTHTIYIHIQYTYTYNIHAIYIRTYVRTCIHTCWTWIEVQTINSWKLLWFVCKYLWIYALSYSKMAPGWPAADAMPHRLRYVRTIDNGDLDPFTDEAQTQVLV